MTALFGIPMDRFALALMIITGVIVVVVLLLALTNMLFFKIGVRNIPRRRSQMFLIIGALMLSTTLLSSVLTTGDVLTSTMQTVAVFNWGNVDELVEGGSGTLGVYSERIYQRLQTRAQQEPDITALGAALRMQNILIADETSRQVRSKVTALGIVPDSELGFGGMIDQATRQHRTIRELGKNEVYLNITTAQFLNASSGDTLYLYSQDWPGKRFQVRVAGIVSNDGLVGDNPFLLANVQTMRGFQGFDEPVINQIFVRNRSGTEPDGTSLSDVVSVKLEQMAPRSVHVIQVKQQGVENTQKAEDIFSRIFALFTLFALAIGLLLILLIFVLLAAERRKEMGMARAIGVQRRHLILMFLFEGAVYDLLASFVGLLFGVGGGAALIWFLRPLMARFNFPLKFSVQPRSFIIAYCLGVIFTFCSVVFSSWLVSRMNVIEALRDLPEAGKQVSLRESLQRAWQILCLLARLLGRSGEASVGSKPMSRRRQARRMTLEVLPEAVSGLAILLVEIGLVPLVIGWWLFRLGLQQQQVLPFSCGISLLVVGVGLGMRKLVTWLLDIFNWRAWRRENYAASRRIAGGLFAALAGLLLLGYWALPFDILAILGFRRFQGGIEIFFVAGIMMVLGATWALIANAGLLIAPLLRMWTIVPRLYATMRLAAAYPLHRRFRMGLSVVMFSLVVFAMTVMAVITNSVQNSYADIDQQTGGYDIQASAYFKALPDLSTSLAAHGFATSQFSAIGMRSATEVGVMQLSANAPRWSIYPAQLVDGGFLQGYGLHLSARAKGFENDAAIWAALQQHPDYALIDSSALPYRSPFPVYDPSVPAPSEYTVPATPPNIDPQTAFSLSGVVQGDRSFSAVPLWLVGPSTKEAMKVTVIGVVDNSDASHFGLYIPRSAASVRALTGASFTSAQPQLQTYYFKVAPGQDKRALALALGSAYLDYGLETTVLEDVIWQLRGPRILLSNVLIGVVGVTLLLGVAALAITGTRAVIERRQQIGMLRALGCSRSMVRWAFLLESFLVGAFGSVLGIGLGIILSRNIFAANFFEQYQTGLTFTIPWYYLAAIAGIALLASFLGALLPAWQAGRIAPAEALRYQ
ncbi:hypothetical protein KSC_052560 [Ktedonobacter sp. SOSP1-52]|uniref:ABC transporter permease n=1 Tax=Ktedonobacter sp. SOSP1-52 TaxID=2778366 RepID=UPI0019164656|nr:FtsX-like permease family protein [Ktedonobacter sp. SOSP1-52]GHO66364.1 hypothetical protein KSC_052560 [Ktedonobacter sp. SOSP1-52]